MTKLDLFYYRRLTFLNREVVPVCTIQPIALRRTSSLPRALYVLVRLYCPCRRVSSPSPLYVDSFFVLQLLLMTKLDLFYYRHLLLVYFSKFFFTKSWKFLCDYVIFSPKYAIFYIFYYLISVFFGENILDMKIDRKSP